MKTADERKKSSARRALERAHLLASAPMGALAVALAREGASRTTRHALESWAGQLRAAADVLDEVAAGRYAESQTEDPA